MAFDWKTFLARNRVEHRQASRYQLEVQCPFCGQSDPSKHMSINTQGRGWRCFRNPTHSGRSRAKLIQGLLHCSWDEARALAGYEATPSVPEENLAAQLADMLGMEAPESARPAPQYLSLPKSFRPLNSTSVLADPFWNYLYGRGFSSDEIAWLADHYDLQYATSGYWRYRIVVPVHDQRQRLMTWTARSILPDAEVRYLTLSATSEPPHLAPPGDLLLGLPLLWSCNDPRVLVICEGPFDAMRLSVAGARYGVYATCLFGLNVSEAQLSLLLELSQRFRRMRLLLDDDAQLVLLRILQPLSVLRVTSARLPEGVDDPGAMPRAMAEEFTRRLVA